MPESAIIIIGLTLKKNIAIKVTTHIITLMLFSPIPKSENVVLFIISIAAANIKPAMNGLRSLNVVLMIKLSLCLNKYLKTKYNNINEGKTIENEANKVPKMLLTC